MSDTLGEFIFFSVSFSMLYGDSDLLLSEFTSVLASQLSPILPDLETPITFFFLDFLPLLPSFLCKLECSPLVNICKFSNLLSFFTLFIWCTTYSFFKKNFPSISVKTYHQTFHGFLRLLIYVVKLFRWLHKDDLVYLLYNILLKFF